MKFPLYKFTDKQVQDFIDIGAIRASYFPSARDTVGLVDLLYFWDKDGGELGYLSTVSPYPNFSTAGRKWDKCNLEKQIYVEL